LSLGAISATASKTLILKWRKFEMNKLFIRYSILFLLFFACTSYAAMSVTLEGTALDPSGKAVPGARISLLRSLVAIAECQTDARGYYKFEGLQDGAYQLSASARGLSSQAIELNLRQTEAKKQDIQLEITALAMQVVVSASLGGALAPQIGSSLDVIKEQTIETRGAQNALEVVRGLPGIEVSQTGRRGGATQLYIRGGDYMYNAIFMDGIPLNEFGGNFDFSSLPADGIDRIEVARGPQSALFGSNAVSGVINLISKRGDSRPAFTALAEGGSYSTRRFATGGSGRNKGFSWSYNLSRLDSDGVVANDYYRNQSAFLGLGYHQSHRQFDFHFFGNANNAGAPGPYGSDPNHFNNGIIDTASRGKRNLFGYQLGYNEQFSSRIRQVTAVSFTTNDLFYHYHDVFMGDGNYFAKNLRGVFNTRSEIVLSNNNTLAAGFEYNREQIRHSYITDAQNNPVLVPRDSFAYFAEDRWNPTNRLYVTAGIRIDNLRTHSLPPDAWGSRPAIPASSITKANPRISMAYLAQKGSASSTLAGTRIHGSLGTGIRPPDGFQLSSTNNPNLKPEKSISFDMGVEQKFFASRAILDVTYFYNRFEDQIVSLGGSLSKLSAYTSANLKNSKAQGTETTFHLHPVQSLELSAAYTFLDSSVLALDGSDTTAAPYKVGQQLPRRPRHSGSYEVTWHYGRLTLNTNAYVRGATLDVDPTNGISASTWYGKPCFFTNEGYTRVDAGFSFRVARGVEAYGRINNLLNNRYEEIFGFPAYRANYMGGMRFTFSPE
jgi:outer membrane cobalamin receptor